MEIDTDCVDIVAVSGAITSVPDFFLLKAERPDVDPSCT